MQWYKVTMVFDDDEVYHDEIQGLNVMDAEARATANWTEAKYILVK